MKTKKSKVVLSEFNKIAIESDLFIKNIFSSFIYQDSLLCFTKTLNLLEAQGSQSKAAKKELLNQFTSTLNLFSKIKTDSYSASLAFSNKLKALDSQFVSLVNELSSSLKKYALQVRAIYKQMNANETLKSQKELSEQVYQLDSSVIQFYAQCKEIFSKIKEAHTPSTDTTNDKTMHLFKPSYKKEKFFRQKSADFRKAHTSSKPLSNSAIFPTKVSHMHHMNAKTEGDEVTSDGLTSSTSINLGIQNKTSPKSTQPKMKKNEITKTAGGFQTNNISINFHLTKTNEKEDPKNKKSRNFVKSANKKLVQSNSSKTSLITHQSPGSKSVISLNFMSINSNNITNPCSMSLLKLSEMIKEFLNDMRTLQDSIVTKSDHNLIKNLKRIFEKKKLQLFNTVNTIINSNNPNDPSKLEKEVKDLKEELAKKQTLHNHQIISLSSENDSLKQSNENLIAQVNEMRTHIKNLTVDQKENSYIKKNLIGVIAKINTLALKIKCIFISPISQLNSPKEISYDVTEDIGLLLKKAEENYTNTVTLLSLKANEFQKLKSSLEGICSSLTELKKNTQNYLQEEDNEINIISGVGSQINLLDDSNRTQSRNSSSVNNSSIHYNNEVSQITALVDTIKANFNIILGANKNEKGESSVISLLGKGESRNIKEKEKEEEKEEQEVDCCDGREFTFENDTEVP